MWWLARDGVGSVEGGEYIGGVYKTMFMFYWMRLVPRSYACCAPETRHNALGGSPHSKAWSFVYQRRAGTTDRS